MKLSFARYKLVLVWLDKTLPQPQPTELKEDFPRGKTRAAIACDAGRVAGGKRLSWLDKRLREHAMRKEVT